MLREPFKLEPDPPKEIDTRSKEELVEHYRQIYLKSINDPDPAPPRTKNELFLDALGENGWVSPTKWLRPRKQKGKKNHVRRTRKG